MAESFMGPLNVYTQAFDEQARLMVDYGQDYKKWKFLQLLTVTPVSKPSNKYMRIAPETQMQVADDYMDSRRWAWGSPRPIHVDAGNRIEWLDYFCTRYLEDHPLDYTITQNAVWDVAKTQTDTLARKLMRGIAGQTYAALSDSGNYLAANTATATAAGGGKWNTGTSTARYIQKSLTYALKAIRKATANGVTGDDLILVLSPDVAEKIAASAEVADFVAQQSSSPAFLQGELYKDQLGNYGMPPVLYGIKVLVDDLARDTAAPGATSSKSFFGSGTEAYLISRQGALGSESGGSNFSFLHQFVVEKNNFEVEVLDEPINRRHILSVSVTQEIRTVAKESGFRFTAVVD